MASKGGSVSKTARIVALGIAAKGDLEVAAQSLDESRAALARWAAELSIDPDNAHQSAVGVQAEAIRITMCGLSVRAASERLACVAQLAADVTGAKGMRKLCADLDAKVAAGAISWKTAFNIWGMATRMCDDACGSKVEELCVRDDNPAAGVRGPNRGAHKAKQFLYPSEVAAFVAHLDVPLLWRRLVAVAVYAYMRDGEIRALTWEDVDLEHGSIHVHQALERESGELVPTKGMENRRVPIELELRPLLQAMHKEAAGKAKHATPVPGAPGDAFDGRSGSCFRSP